MSNQEADPDEQKLGADADATSSADVHLLEPREVPLGGHRGMRVRRTLPQRGRTLIGPWCFIDHYGPDDVDETGGMEVPPHPHTGLQTVSWLFAGEIEHRDSTGAHTTVRPGELNLMTAGAGVQHSEVSTHSTRMLHGVQLWVALPEDDRNTTPSFEHYVPSAVEFPEGSIRVFMGAFAGQTSPASTFSPLMGAQVDLNPESTVAFPINPSFEHGVLVDSGTVTINGSPIPPGHLAYVGPGNTRLTVETDTDARMILIGGEPLGEEIVMWWNFIGREHDEIVGYRNRWQSEVVGGGTPNGLFGAVAGYGGAPLPAPTMPSVRLQPRD